MNFISRFPVITMFGPTMFGPECECSGSFGDVVGVSPTPTVFCEEYEGSEDDFCTHTRACMHTSTHAHFTSSCLLFVPHHGFFGDRSDENGN